MPSQETAHPAIFFLSHADTDLLALHAATARLPADFPEIRVENPAHLQTEGDVDAFIDTHQSRDLTNPRFVSEIAHRLLWSDRAKEALSYVDRAPSSAKSQHFAQTEWTDAVFNSWVRNAIAC